MCLMRRREIPGPDWPDPPAAGADANCAYAPETELLETPKAAADDARIHHLVTALPDGAGPLRRVGICNAAGEVYREVTLRGPVQLLYLWAGLNALGFHQVGCEVTGFSRYQVVFGRVDPEKTAAAERP
jgi:hypothetical protein